MDHQLNITDIKQVKGEWSNWLYWVLTVDIQFNSVVYVIVIHIFAKIHCKVHTIIKYKVTELQGSVIWSNKLIDFNGVCFL